ncbi:MAG: hypothetical protein LBS41_02250 [Streptococcaceae bacterium]|jgi:hypothetical protein|nr:hypothetical protein [Streptococcaceae bacterium]
MRNLLTRISQILAAIGVVSVCFPLYLIVICHAFPYYFLEGKWRISLVGLLIFLSVVAVQMSIYHRYQDKWQIKWRVIYWVVCLHLLLLVTCILWALSQGQALQHLT